MYNRRTEGRQLVDVVHMTLPGACAYVPSIRARISFHLSPYGVDIDDFCEQFDGRTAGAEVFNWPVKTWVYVYDDTSFEFEFTRSQLLGTPVSFRAYDVYNENLPFPTPSF